MFLRGFSQKVDKTICLLIALLNTIKLIRNSKTVGLDWYYSRNNQKIKCLICDLIITSFMNLSVGIKLVFTMKSQEEQYAPVVSVLLCEEFFTMLYVFFLSGITGLSMLLPETCRGIFLVH